MVGCDIDGVLTTGWKPPEAEYLIVSGRPVHEWEKTIKELGTEHPIYLRPTGERRETVAAALWKAEMIRLAGITKFYEDEEAQVEIIRAHTTGCQVVHFPKDLERQS